MLYKEKKIVSVFPIEVFISDNKIININVLEHWHDCVELLYMIKGNSLNYINGNEIETSEKDIIILRPGDIHKIYCDKNSDTKILVIKFEPSFLNNIAVYESKYFINFLSNNKTNNIVFINTDEENDELIGTFLKIYEEYISQKTGFELFIKGYLYEIIGNLYRNDVFGIIKENSIEKLKDVLKYVEENHSENVSLNEAAKIVNLSYFHFSRVFKQIIGRTFKEYVDFVKIYEAEKLLINSDLTISEVAFRVGFSNVSSFNRTYKRIRNFTPKLLKTAKSVKKTAKTNLT